MKRSTQRPEVQDPRRGGALVEMAVCLPVLMMVLIGIIEFGRAMSVDQLLTSAAREACRIATHDGSTNAAVRTHIREQVAASVDCSQSSVTVSIAVTDDVSGNAITDLSQAGARDVIEIDVSVPYSDVSYSLARWLSGRTIRASCTMKHE